MDMGIKDRVAVVAGASKGLGRAVAEGLAAEGCHLALCARNLEALKEVAAQLQASHGIKVMVRAVDLSQPGGGQAFCQEAAAQLGRLGILINNAGGPPAGGFGDFSEDDWLRAVRLTMLSAQEMTRAALPFMAKQAWGRVVNLTSVSVKQPLGGLMLSNSIRAAVIGWAKTLADEVGAQGITVNNICQGWILTERVEELLAHRSRTQGITRQEALDQAVAGIPLGRIGRPEEMADLAVFLASERASYITGASYLIDGGLYRGLM